jgi:hypothetical protein
LFTTGYKRLAKGQGILIKGLVEVWWRINWLIGWLQAACEAAAEAATAGCCVTPSEQLSEPRTLYIGFRNATLKKS